MLHVVSIICVLRIESPLIDVVCDTAWRGELYTAGSTDYNFEFPARAESNRRNRKFRREMQNWEATIG